MQSVREDRRAVSIERKLERLNSTTEDKQLESITNGNTVKEKGRKSILNVSFVFLLCLSYGYNAIL